MRKIAGYLTKNRSEKDQKIAQSTHENGYIKPRKTFWRNSKQLLNLLNLREQRIQRKQNLSQSSLNIKYKALKYKIFLPCL
ncbi:hypothetical protein B5F78_10995 [Bacteroides sp. An279]|nr:hypothetical protein B5F78_10995 [Bacteroides sp. An279]